MPRHKLSALANALPLAAVVPVRPRASNDLIHLLEDCQNRRVPVFFFGSNVRVIYRLRDQVSAGFPMLTIAGICDADFGGPVSIEIIRHIIAARPGVIVTDMPEQDFIHFVQSYGNYLQAARLENFWGEFKFLGASKAAMPWISCQPASMGGRQSAMGFVAIICAQFLSGLFPARRFSKLSGAPRRRD